MHLARRHFSRPRDTASRSKSYESGERSSKRKIRTDSVWPTRDEFQAIPNQRDLVSFLLPTLVLFFPVPSGVTFFLRRFCFPPIHDRVEKPETRNVELRGRKSGLNEPRSAFNYIIVVLCSDENFPSYPAYLLRAT